MHKLTSLQVPNCLPNRSTDRPSDCHMVHARVSDTRILALRQATRSRADPASALPRSPRWLVKAGRNEEARFILGRLRGEDDDTAELEFQDICNTVKLEHDNSQRSSYFAMFFGIGQGKLHTARRVQLVIWLQILQEWIGIAGITIYGPYIFGLAGISAQDRQWVAGLNNITYMVGAAPSGCGRLER